MQKRLLIAMLALASALLFVGLMPVHGEERIYDSVIRLHVLANSDSDEDQALKLQVRDGILEAAAPLVSECTNQNQAKAVLERNLEIIKKAAEDVIQKAGRNDPIEVLLDTERYPRRSYDSVCFPAGEYLSLRVCIGEAEGQNWWCCLFPRLCLGSSAVSEDKAEEAFTEVGLTPSQYKIITDSEKPVYRVRFKLLELFRK